MNFNVVQMITLLAAVAAGIFVGSADAWNELGELMKIAVPAVIAVVSHVMEKDLFKKKEAEVVQMKGQLAAFKVSEELKAELAEMRA